MTLVDGAQVEAEVLFEHPAVERLIVRSPEHRTVQSLDLEQVHAVTVNGRTTTYADRRELSEPERIERERNGLWGDEAGEGQLGRYARESWDPRPLLVWAQPGTSGDAMDAANWLDEHGEPLAEMPWQEGQRGRRRSAGRAFDGDVLLPAAADTYEVLQPGQRDHLEPVALRHLTVEANASYRVRYTVHGNLWVKDDAALGKGTQTGGLGSGDTNKHTFARFCNYHDEPEHQDAVPPENRWAYAPIISHWVRIDTGEQGSLEIVGQSRGPSDRATLRRGQLIISKDSYLGNGPRGSFYNEPGTTVVLLDGARIGSPMALNSNNRATYGIGGTLLFGHPDKPLTRDLIFSATHFPKDEIQPDASPADRTSGASFVLGPEGRMVVHSVDPARARVVFRPRSRLLPVSQYAVDREYWRHIDRRGDTYYPPKPEFWELPDIPTGVAAVFRGQTDFNGVHFDGFYEHGIVVRAQDRQRWQNVTFGDHNYAERGKLFRDLEP
ncbi:MAG: hypothetical protein WD534_03175 [Phycisphaeraceae bacterium]